ncbi:MAG: NAD(P)/FAD-dependent oxidoreductase [Desulfobulbaceae bacterium]|nr:NAD(P)/FAD-dependent oxidoreductase [Desulfobulbaceae bacterium]
MTVRRVIVAGGGAAGLMAAGQAALAGAEVTVLEKMNRPGSKICISGKGRCNLTNIADLPDFLHHFGPTGKFLRQAFAQFFSTELMDFFTSRGVPLVTERGGRVFPASGKAWDILDMFVRWLAQCNVTIMRSAKVEGLLLEHGKVLGVLCNGREKRADAVILAAGGASYPATGSTGDGYRLAASAGHRIIPVRPALVPLETAGNAAGKMAGLNLRNVMVRMYINGRKRRQEFGELVFAEFGVTGPVVLTLSGEAVDALREGKKVAFSIDLKPALDEGKLDARLLRDFQSRGNEKIENVLRGLLPREMVPVCLDLAGISPDKPASQVNAAERRRLRVWLKDFRLEVSGFRPLAEAIVTAGGVDTKEVDPRTMESRLIQGLYLAGEVLDIQGDTGGYNLQAAFSTGWLAGRSAGKKA